MDRARIGQIVDELAERLDGSWLLIGGALVALWLEPRRVTEDIDIVGMGGTPEERYALMEFADELGLPIEAVNSAADFFVRRIEGWRDETEIFKVGRRGTILRPTPTLFVLLKVNRLSEQDLDDCLSMLARTQNEGLVLDVPRVLAALDALPTGDGALQARRYRLRGALAAP